MNGDIAWQHMIDDLSGWYEHVEGKDSPSGVAYVERFMLEGVVVKEVIVRIGNRDRSGS